VHIGKKENSWASDDGTHTPLDGVSHERFGSLGGNGGRGGEDLTFLPEKNNTMHDDAGGVGREQRERERERQTERGTQTSLFWRGEEISIHIL